MRRFDTLFGRYPITPTTNLVELEDQGVIDLQLLAVDTKVRIGPVMSRVLRDNGKPVLEVYAHFRPRSLIPAIPRRAQHDVDAWRAQPRKSAA